MPESHKQTPYDQFNFEIPQKFPSRVSPRLQQTLS